MRNSQLKSVLVTGVGGDIGWSVIKCLKDSEHNLQLVGCDIDPYACGRCKVDDFVKAPKVSDSEKYFVFMKNTVEKYGVGYIYPIPEVEIQFFDCHREYFDESGIVVFVNNSFIVNTFMDKYDTVNFLKDNGLLYPTTFLIEDFHNQLDFPVVVKARRGWGGRGLVVMSDEDELDFYRSRNANAIVQEYIGTEDEEYTVGVFSNGIDVYSICFRRYLGYGSLSKFAELVHSDEVKRIVETIARASNLQGCMNVQFRKTAEGYVAFEINPRISSTAYFRHCFGFQDVKWWLDMKLNKPINYKLKYQKGIGVRIVDEVFFDCSE